MFQQNKKNWKNSILPQFLNNLSPYFPEDNYNLSWLSSAVRSNKIHADDLERITHFDSLDKRNNNQINSDSCTCSKTFHIHEFNSTVFPRFVKYAVCHNNEQLRRCGGRHKCVGIPFDVSLSIN